MTSFPEAGSGEMSTSAADITGGCPGSTAQLVSSVEIVSAPETNSVGLVPFYTIGSIRL